MDDKVWQEFHCHRCPGDGNYIMVRLNMAINYSVAIVCPYCKARHERNIKDGVILDYVKQNNYKEEICPPKSACSKTPRTAKMKKARIRDGAVIKKAEDIIRDNTMQELWIERFGGDN
jgi:hypothetical protein